MLMVLLKNILANQQHEPRPDKMTGANCDAVFLAYLSYCTVYIPEMPTCFWYFLSTQL